MIIVTDELVGEFEQLFEGAMTYQSDDEILKIANDVREKLDFDLAQEQTPAPFKSFSDAIEFVEQLDDLIKYYGKEKASDFSDWCNTQNDSLAVPF